MRPAIGAAGAGLIERPANPLARFVRALQGILLAPAKAVAKADI